MLRVDLFSLVFEIAFEETIEEFLQHRFVHARGPTPALQLLQLPILDAPIDGFERGCVPGIDIAVCEDDFGFGVCCNEFGGESNGGPIADGLAVPEKLVPVCAGKGGAVVVFGVEGVAPEETVGRILDTG